MAEVSTASAAGIGISTGSDQVSTASAAGTGISTGNDQVSSASAAGTSISGNDQARDSLDVLPFSGKKLNRF